jgi:signal transduction histidine kinase
MRLCLSRFKAWTSRVFACKSADLKNQSELLERLSHELRTSLTGIVGYSEFVESSSAEPMMNFTAKIIRDSSQVLLRASNSFFDLHRMAQGQIRADCSKFSIIELVRSVVGLHQKQAIERDVNLFFTCPTESFLLEIYADTQRVRQVVDAIVFGAVQTAGKGKSIRVDVSLDDDKKFIKLMIISLDSLTDGGQIELLKEFWCNERYKFRLQEGPGVELALAKTLIYFLQGSAEYSYVSDELPRLIVKLPMCYRQAKVSI